MFAGFGGQGILLSGKILAQAAMSQGYEVAWVPCYGPEMRGGTAYCTVVISDEAIGSPIIKNPLHLVAMNGPSLEKFRGHVISGGIVLINTSLASGSTKRSDIDELPVPATEIAREIGNVKAANIVALSAFVFHSKLVDFDLFRNCVSAEFSHKPKLIPLNMTAVEKGQAVALSIGKK